MPGDNQWNGDVPASSTAATRRAILTTLFCGLPLGVVALGALSNL